MKIPIADDDPVSRRLLEKTLQLAGYDVLAVPNGWPLLNNSVSRMARASRCSIGRCPN